MRFALNELQAMLQDQAGRLLDSHASHDRLQAIIDGHPGAADAAWPELKALGLAGLLLPETAGGSGLGMIEAALVAERIGYAALPTPLFGHWAATAALAGHETGVAPDMLAALAAGTQIATVAFGEAGTRWLPEAWQVRIEGGRVNGTKIFVPGAATADVLLVGGTGGGGALVDARGAGVRIEQVDGVDRTRPMYSVQFDDAAGLEIPPQAMRRAFDAALVLLAADAFGGASRVIDMTVEYLKTRSQFGTVIGQFQGVKHQIANVVTQIEPCRGLYWYAAYAFDKVPAESSAMAALAKAHLGDRFLQAARDCVELHGGIGYTWEYDLHIWLKRAIVDFAWGGHPDALRSHYADAVGW